MGGEGEGGGTGGGRAKESLRATDGAEEKLKMGPNKNWKWGRTDGGWGGGGGVEVKLDWAHGTT